jgi:hypothetical protein
MGVGGGVWACRTRTRTPIRPNTDTFPRYRLNNQLNSVRTMLTKMQVMTGK